MDLGLHLGGPWGSFSALWASFWRFKKKSRKKDAKNEQRGGPPGALLRNARIPGEDLGGVKTQQQGAEGKVQSKTEEELREQCCMISHAPATSPTISEGGAD